MYLELYPNTLIFKYTIFIKLIDILKHIEYLSLSLVFQVAGLVKYYGRKGPWIGAHAYASQWLLMVILFYPINGCRSLDF